MLWLATAAPPSTASPWLYVLAAVLGGGVLELAWKAYQRTKYGGRDDALSIARAAQEQAANSNQLWTQYKVELEDAKAQLNEYLQELVKVNQQLGAATARIARLEDDLRHERNEAGRLREELVEAKARRDQLLVQVEQLNERIRALEAGI